ncbi:MAG: DUF2155 domain-containing protein [Cypionkella sp.]|nr:DUF2155 domain-containing protein [Cypionkella sp.]
MIRLAALCAVMAVPAFAVEMAQAPGAELRILDKLTGELQDAKLEIGQTVSMGKITVQLGDCRYPAGNQTAEAEAQLTITDAAVVTPVFAGWMIASSPALSALDHPRYDVWVMRCDVPELAIPDVEPLPEGEDQPEEGETTEDGNGQ